MYPANQEIDMQIGSLYIVSAPSGAGKTSLINALIHQNEGITVAVSHTTRPSRPGEIDGQHYHFIDSDDFKQKISKDYFLESAEVFGNFYGTSHKAIDDQLQSANDVILEIDWQGAQQIRKLRPDAISIFILPPSVKDLEQRLRDRQQDSKAVIQKRLSQSQDDMRHYDEFDFVVINDDFDKALDDLASIFKCHRTTLRNQQLRHQVFFNSIDGKRG